MTIHRPHEQPAIILNDRFRLIDDGTTQWILQRKNPKAVHERGKWQAVAFCGTREGLLMVALPHHGCQPTEAACMLLKRLPAYFQPGCIPPPTVAHAISATTA